jgi:hypothetical protein
MKSRDEFGKAVEIDDEQPIDGEPASINEETRHALRQASQDALRVAFEALGDPVSVLGAVDRGLKDFEEQILLALEMGVECRLGNTRRLGDEVHRRRLVTDFGEQPPRGLEHHFRLLRAAGRLQHTRFPELD